MAVKNRGHEIEVTVTRVVGKVKVGGADSSYPTPQHAALAMIADEIGDAVSGDVYTFPAPRGGNIAVTYEGDDA